MSKSAEAFEKLTYEEIRSMTLKEVGEWLMNGMDISGDKWTLVERIKGYSETFKCGVMPNEQNRTTSQDISQLSVSF